MRRHRAARDRRRSARQGLHRLEAVEVLDDAARDEHDGDDDRRGNEDPHGAAGEVDPEVADQACLARREATNQRDSDGDADGGRGEVLHGEADHLHGVAERGVGGVRLPVRVRHERDRRVECERLTGGGQPQRVGQHLLDALQQVDEQHAQHREGEDRPEVLRPALLGARVDAHDPVGAAFDLQVFGARVDTEHVVADGSMKKDEHQCDGAELRGEEAPLEGDGVVSHQKRSGFTRATTR